MKKIVIIGAGVGGMAAAMRLGHAGCDVTVVDSAPAVGGKMRTMPSPAGPVDAGPTVLTMKPFFERIFDAANAVLDQEVTLTSLPVLARHHWLDGSTLDLYPDAQLSTEEIGMFAGAAAARAFARFNTRANRLFDAFEGPMMRTATPSFLGLTAHVLRNPSLIPAMSPGRTLAGLLRSTFADARLRQLFGRYATYVGGHPARTPALLSLIWAAESRGVWAVEGGMHNLARAMQHVAERAGVTFHLGETVTAIDAGSCVSGVRTNAGRLPADLVIHAGDPRALRNGLLGPALRTTIKRAAVAPRSLSAFVWSFGAETDADLTHHNVYFGRDPQAEFDAVDRDTLPTDPTLYVYAQDAARPGPGRFEIIMNGPPRSKTRRNDQEAEICRTITFDRLSRMGLTFSDRPPVSALTTPEEFNRMFPATDGSIYGLSPHGMMAAFHRPQARTKLPGLYLAGGGTHPGAGIPMASMSGLHAAEAILTDLASRSPSRRTAMRGGISTGSATAAPAPSRSSPS